MRFFSAERLAALDAENEALSQAVEDAALAFVALIKPDVETAPRLSASFSRRDLQAPWAPYARNSSYAMNGSWHRRYTINDEEVFTFTEDRFGDELSVPVRFVCDPDTWTAEYRQAADAYRAAVLEEQRKAEAEERRRQEDRDRREYARLQAKFQDSEDLTT